MPYVVVKIRPGRLGGNEVTVSSAFDDYGEAEQERRRTHLDHVLGPEYSEFTRSSQCETHVCPLDSART